MTQHKVVSLRLYRLLLRATKPIFRKPYVELLNETVTVFHPHISRLSQGENFLHSYRSSPRKAMREAVQNGSARDVQVCIDMMPDLLRFLRAGKLVYEEDLFKTPRKCHPLGSMRSPYDLSAGGLLLSKIGKLEKLLAVRRRRPPLHEQYNDFMSRSVEYMKRTFSRTLNLRRRGGYAAEEKLTRLGKHELLAYYAFLSLDRLFWLWDINKINEIDHLFHSFTLFPVDTNERLMGNTIFFQSLINNLAHLNLEAYGSVINNELYLKILRKPFPPGHVVLQPQFPPQPIEESELPPYLSSIFPCHPGGIPWKSTSDAPKGTTATTGQEDVPSNITVEASRLSQTVYTHRVSAKHLNGQHYFADRSYEITFRYHPDTFMLEAVMFLDPNKSVFAQAPGSKPGDGRWRVPKDHVIWRIDLSQFHHEEEAGSLAGVSAAEEEDRKHWLYLDREYQGVELPVPAEFYDLPPSPDGRFNKPVKDKTATPPSEDASIFGNDGVVPNVCYVKFARPPSQERIEKCLLPHLRYQQQSSSAKRSTASTVTASTSASKTPEEVLPSNFDPMATGSHVPSEIDAFHQVESTTSTRVAVLETHPSSSDSSSTFTTIETVYHQLPSFLTVEARFCEFHDEEEEVMETEEGSGDIGVDGVFILGDPSDNGPATVVTADELKTVMDNMNLTDEQVAVAINFMDIISGTMRNQGGLNDVPANMRMSGKNKPPTAPGEASSTTGQPLDTASSSTDESDFKTLHANILAENQKRQPHATERFSFTTIRYGHIRDVDGTWIQVTHDGLRMVFHSELFPPEPLPGMPDSNPIPVVQPLTSAQLVLYVSSLLACGGHQIGQRFPNYTILGSNLAIKECGNPEDKLPVDHEQAVQNLGHIMGPMASHRGRRLSWNSAYWNALYLYFRRRQQAVEELYAVRSRSKTPPNKS